jgi:hypothetical protein
MVVVDAEANAAVTDTDDWMRMRMIGCQCGCTYGCANGFTDANADANADANVMGCGV